MALPQQPQPACDALACTVLLTTLPEPPAARVPAPTPPTCCCPCSGAPGHLHAKMVFRGHCRPTPYGVGAVTAHSCPGRPHLLSAAGICSEAAWGGLGNLHVDLGQGSRRSCPFKLAYFFFFFNSGCRDIAASSWLQRPSQWLHMLQIIHTHFGSFNIACPLLHYNNGGGSQPRRSCNRRELYMYGVLVG